MGEHLKQGILATDLLAEDLAGWVPPGAMAAHCNEGPPSLPSLAAVLVEKLVSGTTSGWLDKLAKAEEA